MKGSKFAGAIFWPEFWREAWVEAGLAGDFVAFEHLLLNWAAKNEAASPVSLRFTIRYLQSADSFFARAAVKKRLSPEILAVAAGELERMAHFLQEHHEADWWGALAGSNKVDAWEQSLIETWQKGAWSLMAERLAEYYVTRGFGDMARYNCFEYNGEIKGITDYDDITLDSLIGYEQQKQEIIKNTELFLRYNKGNNLLLYGERGTGKSSMIKAVSNLYSASGLALVQVWREHMRRLPQLFTILAAQPRHFIVFLDDLTFASADDDYQALKAVLDGGVRVVPQNVLLYATTNRRHLVRETWQSRMADSDDVSPGDARTEHISLADRFGMTIVFPSPKQEEYLNIVHSLAREAGVSLPAEEVSKEALRWALWQNSRSGRTAKQFISGLAEE